LQWSDPPSLRALDPQSGQWTRQPSSFLHAAQRILGPNQEAAEEAVNLAIAAFAAAVESLAALLPHMTLAAFEEAVLTMRADPHLRSVFKASYATKTAQGRAQEFPGVPTMLTDPFCLETNPARYWFDAETCERLVCTFIARQTLNRRRALLDIHESGTVYSLRGLYRSEEPGAPCVELSFVTDEDVYCQTAERNLSCRYSLRPVYEYRKSVRKLAGAEVVVETPNRIVLDLDLQSGALIDCFQGYRLVRVGETTGLHESPTRVEMVPPETIASIPAQTGGSDEMAIVNQYTFTLIKRAMREPEHRIALNRAIIHCFTPDAYVTAASGWAQRYSRWIRGAAHTKEQLIRTPEEKIGEGIPNVSKDGSALNVLLAVWLQAQLHVSDLPTDAPTFVRANTPRTLRELPRKSVWNEWAKRLRPEQGISPKQMVDAWATSWKLLELVLHRHNNAERSRITFTEFADAMPVKVYPNNFEAEFEVLRRELAL